MTYLALDHNDTPLAVHGDATGMLENVGSKLSHELSVLVVDMDLVGGRALCNHDISAGLDYSNSIRIEQLSIPLPTLSELELEPSLPVEYLNTMIIRVRYNDLVVGIHCHSGRLCELSLGRAKFSKLTVINHFLTLDGWGLGESEGIHEFGAEFQKRVIVVEGRGGGHEVIHPVRGVEFLVTCADQ